MEFWQQLIIILYGILALIAFITSYYACSIKKKSYENTPLWGLFFTGFVQADNVIFGFFWVIVSVITLILQDWILFLLTLSVFWLVRSIGETFYWFLQQFHPRTGNEPEKFWSYRIVKNDAVWFMNQIYWQCLTVITTISSLYLGYVWINTL